MTSPLARVGAATGALTTNEAVSIFDTPRGAQGCTFRFDLVDAETGRLVRTLTPYVQPATLSHDTGQTIKRRLSLSLGVSDTAAVDTIAHRVLVYLVDYLGADWPLGRYMFSTNSRRVTTAGELSAPALMDEEFIVDQPMSAGFPQGQTLATVDVGDLLAALMAGFQQISYVAEPTPYASNSSWAFGTSAYQVVTDLATQGAYFSPWIDNTGTLRLIRAFDPAVRVPDIDWDRYAHVYADSVQEDDDLLTAPNRFIVVSNSASASSDYAAPIVGTYDIPVNAPNSIQNRGFVVPLVQQLQLTSPDQAQGVATSVGIAATVYETATMTTYPDPRHDSYDVIRWQGQNWLELSWSMDLVAGGAMTHTIRKAYT
jgi:hypothetical protein